MGSFLLSNHWEASYSLGNFLMTGKLPSRWEASFSSETSIPLRRSLLTGKFPYCWEVESLFTGMLLPPGKLFTTTKLLTILIFNRKLYSLYQILGKYTLFTSTGSCLWLFGFTNKIFWKSRILRKFPGKSEKLPEADLEYPECRLLKGKVNSSTHYKISDTYELYGENSMNFCFW